MKMNRTFLLFSMFLFLCSFVWAQNPNDVAPDIYKKIFENDRVRVHHVTAKPDAKIPTHSHPDHVAYIMSECTLTITGPDGKPQTAVGKEGDVLWFDAVTHSAVNSGKTDCHVLIVELKEPKAAN